MTLFSAIALLLIGTSILYLIGRRRFARRGFTGLESFKTYHRALATRIIERIGRLIAWLMILGSLFLALVYLYNS